MTIFRWCVAISPCRLASIRSPYAAKTVFFPLKEFELLEYLMQNKGRVMTRHQLIDRIWGSDYVGDTKTLDVHVKRVRSKIEEDPAHPKYLTTVRGLGYKIDTPAE